MTFDPRSLAESLSRAWQSGVRIPAASLPVADEAQGYAVQDALITVGRQHGPADVKRLAPVLGIEGDQLVTDGRRVFGVLEGGRS